MTKDILCKILKDLNSNYNISDTMYPEYYNIKKPYTYEELIGLSIIHLFNGNEDSIDELMRKENIFDSKNDRRKYIISGEYISKSLYRRFNYSNETISIKETVNKLID